MVKLLLLVVDIAEEEFEEEDALPPRPASMALAFPPAAAKAANKGCI
jgi:hypothetical protein